VNLLLNPTSLFYSNKIDIAHIWFGTYLVWHHAQHIYIVWEADMPFYFFEINKSIQVFYLLSYNISLCFIITVHLELNNHIYLFITSKSDMT